MVAKRLKRIVSKIDQSDCDISADILPPVVTEGNAIASIEEVTRIFQATLDRLEVKNWTLEVDNDIPRSRFSSESVQPDCTYTQPSSIVAET